MISSERERKTEYLLDDIAWGADELQQDWFSGHKRKARRKLKKLKKLLKKAKKLL